MKRVVTSCIACLALLLLIGCERPDSSAKTVSDAQETSTSQPSVAEDENSQADAPQPGAAEDEATHATETYINKGASSGLVSVKDFGATGDGETDDTKAIQKAISSEGTVFFPAGNYVISEPIMITGKKFWSLYAQDACFVYRGDDFAIKVNSAENCHIEIGEIVAANGGGIKFYADDEQNWNQYVSLTFNYIECATDCINIRVTAGWSNENQVYGGRFAGGENGVRIENPGGDWLNGWKFYNCGIEGVSNGFLLDAGNGRISEIAVVNARYSESYDTILQTIGNVSDCLWIGTHPITANMVSCSADTTRFEILAPIGKTGHRGCIVDGKLMAEQVNYTQAY